MHTNLGPGAQMLLIHKWRKMDTLLFFFLVLVKWFAFVMGLSFFNCGSCFRLNFSRVAPFTGTFAVGLQNWFDHEWIDFGGFLLHYASFRRLHFCMDQNLKELFFFVFCWRHQLFSILSLRGNLVCSLNLPPLFIQRFPDTNWWEIVMQSNSTSIVCESSRLFF